MHIVNHYFLSRISSDYLYNTSTPKVHMNSRVCCLLIVLISTMLAVRGYSRWGANSERAATMRPSATTVSSSSSSSKRKYGLNENKVKFTLPSCNHHCVLKSYCIASTGHGGGNRFAMSNMVQGILVRQFFSYTDCSLTQTTFVETYQP